MTPKPIPKLLSYARVSTIGQGRSGLGLEAQRAAVAAYASQVGGEIVGEYVEVESGRRRDRPKLAEALAAAKRMRARLVVAKIDRLARSCAFIAALLESNVDFVACDMPSANRMILQILASVAEEEARACASRTRAALAAAKARGVRLGTIRTLRRGNPAWCAQSRERARQVAERLRPHLEELLRDGPVSFSELAREITAREVRTEGGQAWSARTLRRATARLGIDPRAVRA